MARRVQTLEEKITAAQSKVILYKDRYQAALEELNALIEKKKEIESKELLKAISNSKRTYDEIMDFLSGSNDENS